MDRSLFVSYARHQLPPEITDTRRFPYGSNPPEEQANVLQLRRIGVRR